MAQITKVIYTGVTNDIDRRLFEHQSGLHVKCYTFKKRPVELVFVEHFQTASHAIEFEKQIKGWRRAKKEALINREWEKLPELSVDYKKLKSQR
ncbi:MAG: GIY-YIG nuclease family protein [Sphingobacteriaceae bacterium]|nr:GIY-YIG nuclease family protein [Sphingobacteriaceae bacterium]